jgi:hypothetical protein
MSEEFKPLDKAEDLLDLITEIQEGLLVEYEFGFNSAFSVITSGLEVSLAKAREMPEAQNCLVGLESAIYVVKGLKEEFDKLSIAANTVTETLGENTNG